jgi:hypothetical protein
MGCAAEIIALDDARAIQQRQALRQQLGRVNARDITVHKNVVDSSARLNNDVKQKLREAREAIENAELSDADKADVIDDLNKLTAELDKPERTMWNWPHESGHISHETKTSF